MRRPPRRPGQRLFTRPLVLRSLLQGCGAFAATVFVMLSARRLALVDADLRMLAFSTLVMTNIVLILANRSLTRPLWHTWRTRNPALRWLVIGAAAVLGGTFYIPSVRDLFRMSRPHVDDLSIIALASLCALVWMELIKRLVTSATSVARPAVGDAS